MEISLAEGFWPIGLFLVFLMVVFTRLIWRLINHLGGPSKSGFSLSRVIFIVWIFLITLGWGSALGLWTSQGWLFALKLFGSFCLAMLVVVVSDPKLVGWNGAGQSE